MLAGEFRPEQMEILRKHDLPADNAARDLFDGFCTVDGEAGFCPSPNGLLADAEKAGESLLSAERKKSVFQGGFMSNHVDSVAKIDAISQQKDDAVENKIGVEIWERVIDEMHRRRLPIAWLQRKLNCSRQVTSSWGRRGVPGYRYEQLAEALGWSIDRLVTGDDKSAGPATTSELSPKAHNLARTFDALASEDARRRVYALMMQMLLMTDVLPIPSQPHEPEPAAQPRKALHCAQ